MKLLYILLIGTLLLCGSGTVSADNLTLFTDEDTIAAQETIDNSGIGYVFALMDVMGKYLIFVVIFVLMLMGLLYRAMNNAEKYKGALAAIFYVIGILLIVQVAYSIITSMIPDISNVNF